MQDKISWKYLYIEYFLIFMVEYLYGTPHLVLVMYSQQNITKRGGKGE